MAQTIIVSNASKFKQKINQLEKKNSLRLYSRSALTEKSSRQTHFRRNYKKEL